MMPTGVQHILVWILRQGGGATAGGSLPFPRWGWGTIFLEGHLCYSRRTAELVVNHSRRFYESPRSIATLCSVSRGTANLEKGKIGESQTHLSILLGDSTNL
jgi:hypothetical protein